MANTGPFIYNTFNWEVPKGTPVSGSPFNIPLDSDAGGMVEIVENGLTESIAQSFLDKRIITDTNDPNVIGCLPACLTNLGLNEYPAEFVHDVIGESFHGQNDTGKVCMTFIL